MKKCLVVGVVMAMLFGRTVHGAINAAVGESLWCISKQIGSELDVIESSLAVLRAAASFDDTLVSSELSVLISQLAIVVPSQLEGFISEADNFLSQAIVADSIFDVTASQAAIISSQVDLLTLCEPQSITTSTTILAAGSYCLCTGVGTIRISVSDVTLDLRGNIVSSSILIDPVDQVLIENGIVEGAGVQDAVSVSAGASNITLSQLIARNAVRGVGFTGVAGGLVESCELIMNVTGIEIISSYDIIVDRTIARSNTNSGFSLVSSFTTLFCECKALKSGQGNMNVLNNNIYGFVSQNGFSNIFENCIANATQALSTTDYNSIVAGFALTGTENGTKIINCEAANAMTSASGVTVPYGIYLQNTLTGLSITTTQVAASQGANQASWSSDGIYVAMAQLSSGNTVLVYKFDRTIGGLIQAASADGNGNQAQSVQWSPDGRYLAAVGNTGNLLASLLVYRFERTNNTLTQMSTPSISSLVNDSLLDVSWSPDGTFLAVVGTINGSNVMYIYSFDEVNQTVGSNPIINSTGNNPAQTVSWSLDGAYLAVGTQSTAVNNNVLLLYLFNRSIPSATQVDSAIRVQGNGQNNSVVATAWSSDGQYVAAAGQFASSGSIVQIYSVNRTTNKWQQGPTVSGAYLVPAVAWSPDGRYIAIGGVSVSVPGLIYHFDKGFSSLVQRESIPNELQALAWSPDGRYLAGGDADGSSANLFLYNVLNFPSDNVIMHNTVYCNSGAKYPSGVGISGSSVCNYIVGNAAYSNPNNPSIISTNYYFVCNVYNQLFNQFPTLLQNIALGSCEPISTQVNTGLVIQQAIAGVQAELSQIALIQTAMNSLQSQVSVQTACNAIPITTPTTIIASGVYCVSNTIQGSIVINQNDVVLDLNGNLVNGTISVMGNSFVTIRNGTIDGQNMGNAIDVQSGARSISIHDLFIRHGIRGISLAGVSGGHVARCELVQNTTGLEAVASHNVFVEDSIARSNQKSGFSLVTSFTNTINVCKAFNTGDGNNAVLTNNVYGFVSQNGSGNIFENCIANATQALSTTDYNSIVAGFALTGTENGTKIINCEASNAITKASGVTVPYGIWLQDSLSNFSTVTFVSPGIGVPANNHMYAASWTSDAVYLAIGGNTDQSNGSTNDVFVYQLNRVTQGFAQVTSVTPGGAPATTTIRTVAWSPNNQYLAAGGNTGGSNTVFIYNFDRINNSLTPIVATTPFLAATDTPYTIAWSPDQQYLAVAGQFNSVAGLYIYAFDAVGQRLSSTVASISLSPSTIANVVAWSPDEQYLLVGTTGGTSNLFLYVFNQAVPSVTSIYQTTLGSPVNAIQWSPDGQYVAAGGNLGSNSLSIFSVNRAAQTLTFITSVNPGTISGISWSPDGQYIAVSTNATPAGTIYRFDRGTLKLSQVGQLTSSGTLQAIAWSPSGAYLVMVGAYTTPTTYAITMYNGLSFPSDNVIMNNTVYCNSGSRYPSGVGISGSSICNMITQNTAYSNPLNPLIVSTNYYFVCNAFNAFAGLGPTELQNIALGSCDPIPTPANVALTLDQIFPILAQGSSLLATIVSLNACSSISITSATGTTINASGVYCLAQNVTGAIQINASNVVLDLNNYTVTGSITVAAATQVIIRNGAVVNNGSSNGIDIQAGSHDITVQNVSVRNAVRGISFASVSSGLIDRCQLVQNTTGLELNQSFNVLINKTVSYSSKQSGFSLISSYTNTIQDCQSLETGENNNTVINNNVYGFVSQNGFSNIFENCIANATQALSTTDFNSIVAGFALTGTENGTKIINCEASNAVTKASGVTVPYGIWLQGTVNASLTLTATPAIPSPGSLSGAVWSPDGSYIATAGTSTIEIYFFNRVNFTLTAIASAQTTSSGSSNLSGIIWGNTSDYIAVIDGSANILLLYQFNRSNYTLNLLQSQDITSPIRGPVWRFDDQYLLACQPSGFNVYFLNKVSNQLSLVASIVGPGGAAPGLGFPGAWSPDGRFIAIAYQSGAVVIYSFFNNTPTIVASLTPSPVTAKNSISWSPDGALIASGDRTANPSFFMYVYSFNPQTYAFTILASTTVTNGGSVWWSPDSRYISVQALSSNMLVYYYDRGAQTLSVVAQGINTGSGSRDLLQFSPDGRYIVDGNSGSPSLGLYAFLSFPSDNMIMNNLVYNNSGAQYPSGVGISGSSICNYIVGNTAYSNPTNPSIVSTNYNFVCNVFNPSLQNSPTIIQNNALGSCDPIALRPDLATLLLEADLLVSALGQCGPQSVIAAATTLSASGNYCLAADATGDITITTTGVYLDLNQRCLTGRITIQTADDAVVANGSVKPAAPTSSGDAAIGAINVAASARYAIIRNVVIACTNTTTAGLNGRSGILVSGINTQIINCKITAGNADTVDTSAAPGAGGDGIVVQSGATQTLIQDCVIMNTGAGGLASSGNTGGRGGHGVFVQSGAVNTQVMPCVVEQTGAGGNTSGAGTGGAGGSGVTIQLGAIDTAVMGCSFSSMGAGGTGGTTAGAPGMAANDSVVITSNLSLLFKNFAKNIVSLTKFDIQALGETGVLSPNPPSFVVINPFANVFTSSS